MLNPYGILLIQKNKIDKLNMKIFLDTIDLNEIKKYDEILNIAGVTTNPNLARRFGMSDDIEMVREIGKIIGKNKEIHVEAFGDSSNEIIKNSQRIKKNCSNYNLVFKIPFSEEGVKAAKFLKKQKYSTNLHLIFSVGQAIISSSVNSNYICPLVGRLDDIGHSAIDNLSKIISSYKVHESKTLVMGSSIRNLNHVIDCYKIGVDAITIPMKVVKEMFNHPLTDTGYLLFKKDLNQMKQISSLNFDKNLTVDGNTTLFETLVILQKQTGSAVAVSKNNKLAGIFTIGDLNRLIKGKKKFNYNDKIIDYMTKKPISVDITDKVEDVTKLVKKYNLGQFVVLDQHKVLGILDVKDIV